MSKVWRIHLELVPDQSNSAVVPGNSELRFDFQGNAIAIPRSACYVKSSSGNSRYINITGHTTDLELHKYAGWKSSVQAMKKDDYFWMEITVNNPTRTTLGKREFFAGKITNTSCYNSTTRIYFGCLYEVNSADVGPNAPQFFTELNQCFPYHGSSWGASTTSPVEEIRKSLVKKETPRIWKEKQK